jgi:hypothetical protein
MNPGNQDAENFVDTLPDAELEALDKACWEAMGLGCSLWLHRSVVVGYIGIEFRPGPLQVYEITDLECAADQWAPMIAAQEATL